MVFLFKWNLGEQGISHKLEYLRKFRKLKSWGSCQLLFSLFIDVTFVHVMTPFMQSAIGAIIKNHEWNVGRMSLAHVPWKFLHSCKSHHAWMNCSLDLLHIFVNTMRICRVFFSSALCSPSLAWEWSCCWIRSSMCSCNVECPHYIIMSQKHFMLASCAVVSFSMLFEDVDLWVCSCGFEGFPLVFQDLGCLSLIDFIVFVSFCLW